MQHTFSTIMGTGKYIPPKKISNSSFLANEFFDATGKKFEKSNEEIISDFEQITGIKERRYVDDDQVTSDIAYLAAQNALSSSNIDPESLDCIIVAHNFGDVPHINRHSALVPNIAAKVKRLLNINNSKTKTYDIPFGCPGWLEGMILADSLIKTGAKRIMVIGAETLSRISDPHDRDSMIYADGAGAVILEAVNSIEPTGILAHCTRCDALEYSQLLRMGISNNPNYQGLETFLKMDGSAVYEYALNFVPGLVKECLDKVDISLENVSKLIIHQANAKMDEKILQRLFGLYGKKRKDIPPDIMPMTIHWLGNSSVATIPTLLDLLLKNEFAGHSVKSGDIVVFASIGAGMNINVMIYKMP
jgi:3-oxoacyl-[acyl-carrier-protein] synthase-3